MKQHSTSSSGSPGIYIRSAVYLTGQVIATMILGPVMLMIRNRPFSTRYAMANCWVRFNLWLLRNVCGLSYSVEGHENIPNNGGGLVLCKHQSAFETIVLQAIFPPVVFILKQELLRIPIWGWAMSTLEPIAIDRQAKSQALKQILRQGVSRINNGRWVVLFPEGTRVAPGEKVSFGGSGGALAHRAHCPVVPVAHNAGEFWSKNGFLKYPGTIRIVIGRAIDGATLSAAEINTITENWIEARMEEISSKTQGVTA